MQISQQPFAKTLGKVLQWAGAPFLVLYLVVTLTPVTKWIVSMMDEDWYGGNGEVLVVLSGAMLVGGTGPEATMGSDTYLRCVYAAWVLHKQTFHTVVVTGGDGAAEAMARYLVQQGVPEEAILLESRANSTYQNALFTRELLLEHYRTTTPPPVVILTSDYHSWRARHVFQKLGLRTQAIGVPDALKRSGRMLDRWDVFQTLVSEWAKDIDYAALGHL